MLISDHVEEPLDNVVGHSGRVRSGYMGWKM